MKRDATQKSALLFWILFLTTVFLMAVFTFIRFLITTGELNEELSNRATNVSHRIVNAISPTIWEIYRKSEDRTYSKEVTSAILDAEFRDPFVLGVVVYGNFGHVYMGRFRGEEGLLGYDKSVEKLVQSQSNLIRYEPVKSGPMTIGNVRVYLTSKPNDMLIRKTLLVEMIEAVCVSALIIGALFFVLRRALIKPMRSLSVARHTIESLREAVVVTDGAGLVVEVNPFFCELFGRNRSEIMGTVLDLKVLGDSGNVGLAEIWSGRSVGRLWSGEALIADGSGREIAVFANASPVVSSHGSSDYTVTVLQGIEELKRAEEQLLRQNCELQSAKEQAEASSRAKDDFLSIMSHELRTPLNPIIGFGQLIQSELEDPELREQMQVIINSGNHLLRLIDSILEFTKLEREDAQSEMGTFDYRDSCTQAMQSATISARSKSVEMSCEHEALAENGEELEEAERLLVRCDQTKFEQVLLNLVTNAVKFTVKGSVTIRSRLDFAASGGRMRIEVVDTGIGISDEDRERVFHAFTQVDSSLTRRHEGIGLGLAIARKLVSALGGEIGCESALGVGSTFWFEFPVECVAKEEDTATRLGRGTLAFDGKLKALLVEDDFNNRLLAVSQLKRLGYEVTCATDGLEAVEQAQESRFSLILMDLQMANMNGFEAAEIIHQSSVLNRNTPIIACTAHASSITREECKRHSINDFLAKPYVMADLEHTLQRWSGRRIG